MFPEWQIQVFRFRKYKILYIIHFSYNFIFILKHSYLIFLELFHVSLKISKIYPVTLLKYLQNEKNFGDMQ